MNFEALRRRSQAFLTLVQSKSMPKKEWLVALTASSTREKERAFFTMFKKSA